jgi:hypothetical protein
MLENPRWEDMEWKREGVEKNRFAYLGNGISTREEEEGSDMAWYLDEAGGSLVGAYES